MGTYPCSSSARMWSGRSLRARMPAWTAGCSVFTRPSSISGAPVTSLTWRTGRPASPMARAVLPVAMSSTPASWRPRARSMRPDLSLTPRSALMGENTGPLRPSSPNPGGGAQPLLLVDAVLKAGRIVAIENRHGPLEDDRPPVGYAGLQELHRATGDLDPV